MLSLSDDNQTEVIEAFNSTSRYLDDLLNIKGHLKYRSVPLLIKENKKMNASPKFALSNSN